MVEDAAAANHVEVGVGERPGLGVITLKESRSSKSSSRTLLTACRMPSAERSMPTTVTPRRDSAKAWLPLPHPYSSTRFPALFRQ